MAHDLAFGIPAHPYADLFPMLTPADADALRLDIAANGLRERIVILDGQILDGRNRYRAAVGAGQLLGDLPPEGDDLWITHFRRFNPAQDGDPLAFVLSKNKYRRHMTAGQLGMLAADVANLGVGRPKAGGGAAKISDDIPPIGGISKVAASEMVGAKLRNTERAQVVLERGAPELVERVRSGEVAVSAAADIASLPITQQLAILRGADRKALRSVLKDVRRETQEAKRARRQEREADLGARQVALPEKRFGVILADPEWRFETYSADTGMDRSADNHYPTSPLEVIKSRPVASIAADDAALLLWATVPMLPQAFEVMAAWGFAYRSHAVWLKDRIGTGYWFRNQHELLLLGTRGNIPAPAMGDQFRSALAFDVAEHSAKPPFAHEIAETYWPNLPKIELNARTRRPGWEAWGLEAPDAVGLGQSGIQDTHATSEAIAMSFAEARPILEAHYATSSGDELAARIGRPIGTIRTWAHRLGLTSRARLAGNADHLGAHLKRGKETA